MSEYTHYSVLLNESVEAVVTDHDGIYLDGTFGRGGHSKHILKQLSETGQLLAFDKDPAAVSVGQNLSQGDPRFFIEQTSFADMGDVLKKRGWFGQVSGILLDLGVSSPQLDDAERGFSFMNDGPLDMRMNPDAGASAADWVNQQSEQSIIDALKTFGEERFAKRIARAIVETRTQAPFTRTAQLADVVAKANPKWEPGKHPATRAFQAIRIAVNNELGDLEQVLEVALDALKPGGRLVIISFHSLEDRLVKRFFKKMARGPEFPRHLPVTADMVKPYLNILGKAVRASEKELQENVRSRSAIMRVGQKPIEALA